MKKLDIILRTCSDSKLETSSQFQRICGTNRIEMLLKCIPSLINAVNNCNFNIELHILDDHSTDEFLHQLKIMLQRCNKKSTLIHLDQSGFNNSAYQQFLLAAQCEDLVYCVEDDYLHEPAALANLLSAYNYLHTRFSNVALFPYDDPLRYAEKSEEQTILLFDGNRYWRQVTKTTNTIFSSASLFREHFQTFKNLALNYPQVMEDHTINCLYKNFETNNGFYWAFNPIPSIAYHMSAAYPKAIKTGQISWQDLWHSNCELDLINGWFNYESFYRQVAPTLSADSVIVEVGAWLGKSSIGMHKINLARNMPIKIYCVDTWEGSAESYHNDIKSKLAENNRTLYETFTENVKLFHATDFIKAIRKHSTDAASLFQDGSIDLVIIDASHDHENVLKDITSWVPKIKKGGIIAGDDFSDSWPGVQSAVKEFFGDNGFSVYNSTWFKRI